MSELNSKTKTIVNYKKMDAVTGYTQKLYYMSTGDITKMNAIEEIDYNDFMAFFYIKKVQELNELLQVVAQTKE